MAPVVNTRVIFNEVPKGYPDPEKTLVVDKSQKFDIDTVPLNGGIAVKILVLSIDPYIRGRLREADKTSYINAFALGEPISNFGVAVVLKTENSSVAVGDHLYGLFPFAEYAVLPDSSQVRKINKVGNLPWSAFIGVGGMPGKTAYHGWHAYIHPHVRKGETIFVTTAAGPVGSLIVQLAKADGLKVIASSGSDEKVKFTKEIGADVAFNYKTTSTKEILDKYGPINYYWDHVGGEILDLALAAAAPFARFVEVGLISGYNSQHEPLKNYPQILFKSLTVTGFIVGNLEEEFGEAFYREIPPKLASGEIKYLEYVKRGLETTSQTLLDVLTGRNIGKAIIVVADE